jgi:hypothetical protein
MDVINRVVKNQEILSWFVTIDKVLASESINTDLVYRIIERDKYKLYKYDICRNMDTYKLMNFIPIVINTLKYLKDNTNIFKGIELKALTKV